MSGKKSLKRKLEGGIPGTNISCIIHYPGLTSTDSKVTPLSGQSYSTLLQCKEIRRQLDSLKQHAEQCESIPTSTFDPQKHGYHRQCYQKFTKAKSIRKPAADASSSGEGSSCYLRIHAQTTSSLALFPATCGICDKKIIRVKSKKQYPTAIVTKTAENTLKKAAELHDDHNMLTKIRTEDLIAREFCKHEKCYKNYTRITLEETALDPNEDGDEDPLDKTKFADVCRVIENNILQRHQSISMGVLNEISGVGVGDRRYRYKLKDRLKKVYGDSIVFVTVDSQKPQVVISAESLKGSTSEIFKMSDNEILRQSALLLRQIILDFAEKAPPLQWPPTAKALKSKDREPPEEVISFFKHVLKPTKHRESDRVSLLSKSYSQDLIHGVTHGRFLTEKHALVGVVIHNMTGQKIPLNILSQLGNSASYDQVCEIETGLAELSQHLQQQNQFLPLQPKLNSSVLTFFWMDNFDYNIETSTGHGTIHNTHGVVYQEMSDSTSLQEESVEIPRSRRRTIVSSPKELEHRHINPKKKPPKLPITNKPLHSKMSEDIAKMKLMLWKLCREAHSGQNVVPRYTGWMTLVSNDQLGSEKKTVITYLPPIHSPITDYATVIEYLSQTQRLAEQANMSHVHLTLDVGAAAKAFQTVWNFPNEFQNIEIHLGDFHLMQENFSIIGQLVNCSGFEDIVFQAGLCASGSLSGVLRGKHYNRAWVVHEHFADALERLLLRRFLEYSQETNCLPSVLLHVTRSSPQPIDIGELLKHDDIILFQKRYEDFRQHIRQGDLGKTPMFWMIYLDMLDIQNLLHASIKENDYDMRLLCWKNSLPLCFAFNKQNYARYGSWYVQRLNVFKSTFPEAKRMIEKQGLSVRRSHHKSARQAIDQAGEQTYNRSAKVPGGIKQFAGNIGAYEKWVLNRPHVAKLKDALMEITGLQTSDENPVKTCSRSEIKKSEKRVQALLTVLVNDFINPFDADLDTLRLFNLSSGAPVAFEIEENLTTVMERGRMLAKAFVDERLEGDQKCFFDPIAKAPLRTFKDTNQKVKLPIKGKVKELTIERDTLGKLVALSNKHKAPIDIDKVLTYCLGPVPLCLAHPDGTRRKTTKSKILDIFSQTCQLLDSSKLPEKNTVSAYIIDLMATVRIITQIPETFEELAVKIFTLLPVGYSRMDVVADTYRDKSIKEGERNLRGCSDKYIITSPKTKVPRNFSHFLSNGPNKERLIDLIMQVWEENRHRLLDNQKIYFSKKDKCYLITNQSTTVVNSLCSDHEEADTKISLHVQHALTTGNGPVIIRSPSGDTDIPVILLALFHEAQNAIYLDNGHGNNRKIFNIASCELPVPIKKAIVGLHAFTGNDYVSAFFRKGKNKCYTVLQMDPQFIDAFVQLGSNWDVDDGVMGVLEQYVCKLYGKKNTDSVNVLRQQIFWEKFNKDQQIVDLSLLPPCNDSLVLHTKRANYVCRLWRLSFTAQIDAPVPSLHGWTDDLSVQWTTTPFPDDILSLLCCDDDQSDAEMESVEELNVQSDDDEDL